MKVTPLKILNTEEHGSCYKDVCILRKEENAEVGGNESPLIWVEDKNDNATLQSVWCFFLPNLLLLFLTTNINPYTGQEFSKNIVEEILNKYKYETKLVEGSLV